jgi:hypothetical protein
MSSSESSLLIVTADFEDADDLFLVVLAPLLARVGVAD